MHRFDIQTIITGSILLLLVQALSGHDANQVGQVELKRDSLFLADLNGWDELPTVVT